MVLRISELKRVYLDNQSTTPCDRRVLEKMLPYFCEEFGNPHSFSHEYGYEATSAVEEARDNVAHIIGASPEEIIFTSGATESNNLAIKGAVRFYKERGNHVITVATEHKCVLESCMALGKEGFEVTILPVQSDGLVNLNHLLDAINDRTILVSVMTVNNEIGVIQDINAISSLVKQKSRKIVFHTDAAQAVGKIDIKTLDLSNIDLMSISGHKIYGPKGIGALYVKMSPRIRLEPLFSGGGQEKGMRSGTLATPLCVGLGEACRIAEIEQPDESKRILEMRNWLLNEIQSRLPRVFVNGDVERRIPGNLNVSFEGVEGEGIMMGLDGIAVSSGSACTSATLEPSYVISALGGSIELSHSSIRIGLGRFTTYDDLEYFMDKLVNTVNRLRGLSPIWEA